MSSSKLHLGMALKGSFICEIVCVNAMYLAGCTSIFFCFVLFFVSFVFVFLGLHPQAHGGSQARDQIGAVVASLRHSHSNTGSETRLLPTPQLKAMLDP